MEFNSQICTTKEQSKRLLALGLKKETADCFWISNTSSITGKTHCRVIVGEFEEDGRCVPAWSLHRLIEMMPQGIQDCSYRCFVLAVNSEGVSYEYHYVSEDGEGYEDSIGCTELYDNLYDDIIAHIEWLIKEGHFNKEYLEE